MPHQRNRTITSFLLKRLKLWPVLGLIGPRQCGKSTLLRDIISQSIKTDYMTMDSESLRKRAEKSPESFSEMTQGTVKILDEVQKVPSLFDAIKLHVDQKRRPGSYILSGSTRFSSFFDIRESLTGRIGMMHLYPFSLSEIHSLSLGQYYLKKGNFHSQLSMKEFDIKIEKGGMPGFFYLHSAQEFGSSAQIWLETTCFRDLGKVLRKNYDGDLAYSILTTLVQSDIPTATETALRLEKDTRVVSRYLDAFSEILVLKKINPHTVGVGKSHYVIVDSGLATFLGASRKTALRSHVLVEALSLFEASGLHHPIVEYYHSEKKSYVPLIFSWKNEKKSIAVQISDRESPHRREIQALESFIKKQKDSVRGLVLNQSSRSYSENNIEYHSLRG